MTPSDMIVALRRGVPDHKGPFAAVEGYPSMGASDNALRWSVVDGGQKLFASGLSQPTAEALSEMLNVADVACIIADNGGRVLNPASEEVVPVDLTGVSLNDFLLRLLEERKALRENLTSTQERSSQLLLKAREWRKKIIELGGEDPGPP